MEDSDDKRNKLIIRKIKDKDNLLNFYISVLIILVIFLFENILIFAFNISVFASLSAGFLLLLLYLIILTTLLNPSVVKKQHHNYILIERKDINEVKSELKREDNTNKEEEIIKKRENKDIGIIINNTQRSSNIEKSKIPKTDFLGSSDTKVYHRNNCRFVKMIHLDYLDANNDEDYFIRKGYKHCLVCIDKK